MASHQASVMETIAAADAAFGDPMPGRKHFYRTGLGPSRRLRVIVDFNQHPALIVIAHGYGKELPSDSSGPIQLR
jgi:hypothetical protein